jgi:D-3-phosphoglycerate dehydrogenase
MRDHGVRLGWTAGVNARAVAEHSLSLMLALLRHLVPLNLAVREGRRPLQKLGRQLSGRTVGIHGLGHIGKELARLLQPFGCTLLACDLRHDMEFNRAHGVRPVDFDRLLAESEILSIHLPVTRLTRGLYDVAVLARLRPEAVLINTARGRIVDETALREALSSGRLGAAGFDAFEREPPEDDALLRLPNFIATPHVGASTAEARWAMGTTAIEGLTDNFLPEPGVYPFEDR